MIYLATVFTNYYLGQRAAFVEASRIAGRLVDQGLHVFSPIAHSYPLTLYGGLDPIDPVLWDRVNTPYLRDASTLYVTMMNGWKSSRGVKMEIDFFEAAGKHEHIFYLNPNTLKVVTKCK